MVEFVSDPVNRRPVEPALAELSAELQKHVEGVPLGKFFLAVFREPFTSVTLAELTSKFQDLGFGPPQETVVGGGLQRPGIFGLGRLLRGLARVFDPVSEDEKQVFKITSELQRLGLVSYTSQPDYMSLPSASLGSTLGGAVPFIYYEATALGKSVAQQLGTRATSKP